METPKLLLLTMKQKNVKVCGGEGVGGGEPGAKNF
jgi:hypothetical protein